MQIKEVSMVEQPDSNRLPVALNVPKLNLSQSDLSDKNEAIGTQRSRHQTEVTNQDVVAQKNHGLKIPVASLTQF